jgi:light-regulated signal transduction histidine kinase (bacteriophytochrome)
LATGRLAGGDTSARVAVNGPTEIGQLALTFNEMAANISQARQSLLAANRELVANNELLSRSNADLQTFVFAASHDLREPLRMVASYLGLIARQLKPAQTSETSEFLGYARDGAQRMKRLLDDLLTYCRLDKGAIDRREQNLGEIVDEVRQNLSLLIQETDTRIECGPLPTVRASRAQLVLLFQNLLSNAIKFRSQNAPVIHIDAVKDASDWEIRVRDNGIGFDPEESARVFQAFQRLHSHSAIPGSGLGLAICKRIVEGWGGKIGVDPQPGRGTTFYFTFPDFVLGPGLKERK